jgi:hypothetical protein
MPNPKFALKFLLTASALNRGRRRADWVLIFALFSTVATMALVGLYLLQRSSVG